MGAFLTWRATLTSPGGLLEFDITTAETLVRSSAVTEFPVEEGANIADHVRPNLDKLTLEVFVSNHPITDRNHTNPDLPRGSVMPYTLDIPSPPKRKGLGALTQAVSNLFTSRKDPPVASLLTFATAFNAVAETWEVLDQLRREARLVEVVARDFYLESMVITTITQPRTAEDGSGSRFTIELTEIRIVETKQTITAIPAETRAKGKLDAGSQPGKTKESPKAKTVLLGISEKVGSLF